MFDTSILETLKYRKCVAYARFSSDNQTKNSIAYQMAEIKKFCKKNEITLLNSYEDEGFSGTTARRPAFQRLIKDAMEKPEWDLVLVYDMSRFARNYNDAATYENMLNDWDIELVSITQLFDNTNEGELLKGIINLLNHYYSKNNAKHTHAGMLVRAKEGFHCGGVPALGYDVDSNNKLIINEHEASIVRYIFEMFEMGYSYAEMAEILNEEGYTTKNGKHFTKNSFEHILRQKKYAGTYTWNHAAAKKSTGARNSHRKKKDDVQVNLEGGCPMIIDKEKFERVQTILDNRGSAEKGSKTKYHYMLSGIKKLKCAKCGSLMIGAMINTHGKKYLSYYCPNQKRKTDTKKCSLRPILGEPLNEIVATDLAQMLCSNNSSKAISGHINNSKDYRILKDKIRGKEKAIRNLMQIIESGKGDEIISERLSTHIAEKKTLELKLSAYEGNTNLMNKAVADYQEEVKEQLINSKSPKVRKYLERAIDHIDVDDDNITIVLNEE